MTKTQYSGEMTIIHYRTLRANPLFRIFHGSCSTVEMYDTTDPSSGQSFFSFFFKHVKSWLKFLMSWERERGDSSRGQHTPPSLCHIPSMWQVLRAASWVVTAYFHTVHGVKSLSSGLMRCCWAPTVEQHSLTGKSSPDFSVSEWWIGSTQTKKNETSRKRELASEDEF